MFSLADYAYELPSGLIAKKPAQQRERSRLLVLDRQADRISHERFDRIAELLTPSDLLVVNNTQVIPGRLLGKKATGGRVEVLILNFAQALSRKNGAPVCRCLVKASKPAGPGTRFFFDGAMEAEVLDFSDGEYRIRFDCDGDFQQTLYRIGKVPLPPYIRRPEQAEDRQRYQTVYASQKGAIAAPTAGLHFSEALLERLSQRGIGRAELTLHVGYGTFVPVRVDDIREHRIHSESFYIPPETAAAVNQARSRGGRVVAVGTTSVRTLEYASDENGTLRAGSGDCDLFIYPGYRFKLVDAMITNFHLPRSTLLMLVSAFAGRERILAAYQEAISQNYRFYSYGDAMWIR